MDKKARSSFVNVWMIVILCLVAIGVVFATTAVIRTPPGATTSIIYIGDDQSGIFANISINSTGQVGSNVSTVIFNLSDAGNIEFINFTDAAVFNASVLNTAAFTTELLNHSLNFTNKSGMLASGGNIYHFWFNLTPNNVVKGGNISIMLGTINVSANNASNLTTFYNITLHVNDSMTLTFNNPTKPDGGNVTDVLVNVSYSNNVTVASLAIELFNATGGTTRVRKNVTIGGDKQSLLVNFSNEIAAAGLPDGTYRVNATVNNSNGDENVTATRTFVYDRTAPAVTLTQNNASSDKDTITLTISVTDATSGINDTCASDSSTATITGATGTQTLTEDSLACGKKVSYTVTCKDSSGNSASSSAYEGITAACAGSSSSSGGGSSSTTTWTNTVVAGTLTEPVQRELSVKQRVKLNVVDETHYVGLLSLTATTATIQIASDPVEATFNVGDTKKFDLNADGTYDLSVTLNGIASGKADVSISAISEAVPEGADGETGTTDGTETGGEEGTGEVQPGVEETGKGLGATAWVVIAVVVIVIIVLAVLLTRKRR